MSLSKVLRTVKPNVSNIRKGKENIKYLHLHCGFDIETTTYNENSYMYIFQFSMKIVNEQYVFIGRKWSEFEYLLKTLKVRFGLRDNVRIIIWVANLGYEFQFMRKYLEINELFAKTSRNPLLVRCFGGVEFRDCLSISQGNLAYLAKTWTTTQKMVGDLDYNILRNSHTPLTEEELQYCINDVVILSEFSEKIFSDYIIKEKYIPLTSTGILRHDLKKYVKEKEDYKHITEWIKNLFPVSKQDYLFIMKYLFRGGFVHSDFTRTNEELYNLDSYDLKSSYPSSAFRGYYPVSPFERVDCKTQSEYEFLNKNFCTIAILEFENIKATTNHSIESKSKLIKFNNALFDNGRLRKADTITVFLTELDYLSYKEFYSWESVTIKICQIAKKGNLPKYILDRFYFWFDVKNSIDSTLYPQEYAISKTRINGHYGLCVTRLCFNDVCYNNGEWSTIENKTSYEEMIGNEVLSPFWGIYICAHSRRTELSLLDKMKDETVYSDTDSHKLYETENALKVITDFNITIKEQNKKICEYYGYKLEVLKNIGILEKETTENGKGQMLRFKTLGAKRYICEYKNKGFECTVSGLNKKALANFCKDKKIDCFEAFTNELKVPSEYTNKITPVYNDEAVTDTIIDNYGNVEVMTEQSNVYLKPTDFTLTMERDYLSLIQFWKERTKRYDY